MKSVNCLTFLLFILLSVKNSNAGIITVNNNNSSPGQYSDLQTAINAAQVGDTLLIHRSTTSYGNATLTKRLVLIGEGTLPNKAPNTQTTSLGTLTLTYNSSTLEHASKSIIIGLNISTLNIYEKSTDVNFACDSVAISYCKISALVLKNNIYNLTISKSIIVNIAGGNIFNCKFSNNICQIFAASSTSGSNNLIINNVIFTRLIFNGGVAVNNILYSNQGGEFSMLCKNVIFSNNIMFHTNPATPFDPTKYSLNDNTSINNLFNVDPLFINPVTFNTLISITHTSPTNGPFADFHLQTGSPARNVGTDGTDLGIYGGAIPWKDGSTSDSRYRYYPLPNAVPVITGMTVNNPVVNSGGSLQVQIGATTAP